MKNILDKMRTKKNSNLLKILLLFIGFCIFSLSAFAQQIYLNWQIGYHKTETTQPTQWVQSVVPGAIQLDVMNAENYKQPWWYGENVSQFDWMEDFWFTYKTTFKRPELKNGERFFFFSKGIDYQFKIILNGKMLWEQEGMFTYVDVDLTDALNDNNELRVVILPVPNLGFENEGETARKNARESAKPAVSYGWDWHPRCVTRGIWDETYLIVRQPIRLNDVSISYTLNDELTLSNIKIDVAGMQVSGRSYRWILKDPEGKIVIEKQGVLPSDTSSITTELSSPKLWQPNGYGIPFLYTSDFVLLDKNNNELEHRTSKIGFRRIRLITNEKAWADTWTFPATSGLPPSCLEVNDRRIFAKGTNWVHPEVFVGTITPERYREQLILAKNANFNILRVWGGGVVNKESFFEQCDELGLLIWQEFPLACNVYPDKPAYLRVLEQEAASIVRRLKKHACIALWSGGNELFWAGMTEQSHPLRLLNSVCYQIDPQTPFISSSPFNGVGHGHYLFYDDTIGKEVFQWMAEARRTAYTEFAVPGISNIDVLKSFIPERELFPAKDGTVWSTHHGFGAWRKSSWTEMETYRKYFGEPQSLEELVENSQLLQGEGLKFIYEEARRQKPYCSMALNWCFQEPWPTAANNSLINWPNNIKPAYYQVAKACRPILASIRAPKFSWNEGEDFSCELFMLNDTYKSLNQGEVIVTLVYNENMEISLANWNFKETNPFENIKGPEVHTKLPQMKNGLFEIKIEVLGNPEFNSNYKFLYKSKSICRNR